MLFVIGSNRWRSLRTRGSFTNDLAWIGSSKFLGVLTGLLLTPILTRVYPPDFYGQFAFFNALLKNLALIATFRFPLAFVLPDKEDDFRKLFRGSFISVSLLSILLSLLGLIVYFFLDLQSIEGKVPFYWVLLLGPGVFLFSLPSLLTNWNIRLKEFRRAAPIGFVSKVSTKGASILLGYGFHSFPGGLLFGEFIGKALHSVLLVFGIFKQRFIDVFKGIRWGDLRFSFSKYRNYPLYVLPGNFLNQFAAQVPVFAFLIFFDPAIVGAYSLAIGMLNIPFSLVTGSINPVMTKRIKDSQQTERWEDINALAREYFTKVFWSGLLPVVGLYLGGEFIFSFVFGEEWTLSGAFVAMMGWFVLYRSMSSPLSVIYRVLGKERMILIVNAALFFSRIFGVSIGVYYGDPLLAVFCFTVLNVFIYLFHAWMLFRLLGYNVIGLVGGYLLLGASAFVIARSIEVVFLN